MPGYRYSSPDAVMQNRRGCQCMSARTDTMCEEREVLREKRKDMPLAMAYVPWQQWRELYEAEKGFSRGTIFCELDKPFQGTGGVLR